MSVYYQGIKLTKSKGFEPVNLAAKWKKTYQNKKTKEPWFIMKSLGSLSEATQAYSQRMGIEEMFRDFKKGGYNLESTGLRNDIAIEFIARLLRRTMHHNGPVLRHEIDPWL
ncbi:MAG: hypothetical protein WCO81_05835 [Cyanobacteriota bacterium ELA615]